MRLNGENPAKDFQPCPGILGEVQFPTHMDGVRVDSWVESGTEISPFYDSLLGKLMVYAPTREIAVAKLQEALDGEWVGGWVWREGEWVGTWCWAAVPTAVQLLLLVLSHATPSHTQRGERCL